MSVNKFLKEGLHHIRFPEKLTVVELSLDSFGLEILVDTLCQSKRELNLFWFITGGHKIEEWDESVQSAEHSRLLIRGSVRDFRDGHIAEFKFRGIFVKLAKLLTD